MPLAGTMQSVTTRGFGIGGGFTGSVSLVVTLGYGLGEAAADAGGLVCATIRIAPSVSATTRIAPSVSASAGVREC